MSVSHRCLGNTRTHSPGPLTLLFHWLELEFPFPLSRIICCWSSPLHLLSWQWELATTATETLPHMPFCTIFLCNIYHHLSFLFSQTGPYISQTGLELPCSWEWPSTSDPSMSSSHVLGVHQVWATTPDFKPFIFIITGGDMHVPQHMWRSEANVKESVLSPWGPRDQTRDIRFSCKHLYLLSLLTAFEPFAFFTCHLIFFLTAVCITYEQQSLFYRLL